jgi:hypothetical protein
LTKHDIEREDDGMICKCGHESKEHFNNECFHNVGMCTCWKFEPAIAVNGNIEICGSITQEELAQLRNRIKELEAVVHGVHNKISNYAPDASDSLELLQELQVLCKSTNPPKETE